MDPAALPAGTTLLYPGAAATAAAPVAALLVLDGTWRQSRQLLRLNPWLLAMPRVSLASPPPSRYTARRAHRPEQRSTLEATCLALQALEADAARYAPLLEAFSGWVQTLGRPGSTA